MARTATSVTDALKRVPPFPPVAAKLLSLLAQPEVEISVVGELISSDATFTAKLLQRVNSVEFGLVSPVTNVRQAVALLGLDLTRQITLSSATAAYAKGALRAEELRRCWQHTVATAVLADEIAHAWGEFASVAYTAGIVHDIGRLGLLVAYPAEYESIVRHAASRCLDLLDFEREEFGMDHAEAGRLLAEQWGLPTGFAQIAGRHHDPCEGTAFSLLRIVHVACRLADALGYDVVKPMSPPDIEAILAELPVRGRARFQKTADELRAQIEQSIAEYGSEQRGVPPEEGLAMLAAVAPPETVSNGAQPTPDTEAAPMEQPVPKENARSRKKMVMTVVAAILIASVAAALYFLPIRSIFP